jgi:hypothetical protein
MKFAINSHQTWRNNAKLCEFPGTASELCNNKLGGRNNAKRCEFPGTASELGASEFDGRNIAKRCGLCDEVFLKKYWNT